MSMVTHYDTFRVSSSEAIDAANKALSMSVARQDAEFWCGVFCTLNALVNYNANSAEEFIGNVEQEKDHM